MIKLNLKKLTFAALLLPVISAHAAGLGTVQSHSSKERTLEVSLGFRRSSYSSTVSSQSIGGNGFNLHFAKVFQLPASFTTSTGFLGSFSTMNAEKYGLSSKDHIRFYTAALTQRVGYNIVRNNFTIRPFIEGQAGVTQMAVKLNETTGNDSASASRNYLRYGIGLGGQVILPNNFLTFARVDYARIPVSEDSGRVASLTDSSFAIGVGMAF